jgi:hypothetical protein
VFKDEETVSAIMLTLLLVSMLTLAFDVQSAKAGASSLGETVQATSISQPSAYIIVDPALNSFTTPSMVVGSTFKVNVSLVNITDIMGVQFTLSWDPTLLNCTHMTEVLFHSVAPPPIIIWWNVLKYNNTAGTAIYAQTFQDAGSAVSGGYAPINITTTTFPPDGKEACATFTMEVLHVPTIAEGNLTGAFHLTDVVVGDLYGVPIMESPPIGSTGNPPVDGTYVIAFASVPEFSNDLVLFLLVTLAVAVAVAEKRKLAKLNSNRRPLGVQK